MPKGLADPGLGPQSDSLELCEFCEYAGESRGLSDRGRGPPGVTGSGDLVSGDGVRRNEGEEGP